MRLGARDRERLRNLVARATACPACEGATYMGTPGLFAYLYKPDGAQHGWSTRGGYHEMGDIEVYNAYLDGCPECGADIKRVPILMNGVWRDNTRGKPELPDPWPEHVTPEEL